MSILYRGDKDMEKNKLCSDDVRAQVLIEALPYIRRFHEKTIVVKYGGNVITDEELAKTVIEDIVLLKLVGFRPIIVHGGGAEISKWLEMSGKKSEFTEEGLRITDRDTMVVAQMVLNRFNKNLVRQVQSLGVNAVGLSGADGGMLLCKKKMPGGKDIGYVGDIVRVDTEIIDKMLDDDYIPIICPVGFDENFDVYNINADDAAYEIATAVKAEKLAFLTDVEGLYKDYNDKDSLISEITLDSAKELLESGDITGGMFPKLSNCIHAVENGVKRVHILDGRIRHSLILEIFTHKGVGTAIIQNEEEKFFTE